MARSDDGQLCQWCNETVIWWQGMSGASWREGMVGHHA